MAAIVLKAVFEALKHICYHLLGSLFENVLEAALRKRRRKRKKARTNDLVTENYTECHTIRPCKTQAPHPVAGTCIILGEPLQEAVRVVIIIDDTPPR